MLVNAVKILTSNSFLGLGSYFTLPSIGGLYYVKKETTIKQENKLGISLSDILKVGIPLYPDKYEESGGNDISQQVLVGGIGSNDEQSGNPGSNIAGALVKVADNIVVNPRTWKIHAYTGLKISESVFTNVANNLGASMTGWFDAGLLSLVQKFGLEVILQVFKGTIEYLAEARRPFKFNTKDGETIPCFFKSYKVTSVPENPNFVELDLELQEFRFLALDDSEGKQQQVAAGGITSPFNKTKLARCVLKSLI